MSNFSIDELLRQLMKGANDTYCQHQRLDGLAFVVGKSLVSDEKSGCTLIPAMKRITSLPDLRRFATSVRKAVRLAQSETAGVLCELTISLDGAAPEPSVLLYVDQKYSSMQVYLAPKSGEHLVFRNLGKAHLGMNFLPSLIPIEAYGAIVAEA